MTTRLTAATSSRRAVLQSARRLFARGPASRARALAIAIVLSVAVAFVALYPPRPSAILAALSGVSWTWLSIALLVNVASIVFRAEAWRLLMAGSVQGAGPGRLASLSGYSVGLLGNTLLPARAGEAARIVVATRHLPPAPGRSSAVAGSVLAQRFLDQIGVEFIGLTVKIEVCAREACADQWRTEACDRLEQDIDVAVFRTSERIRIKPRNS